MANDELQYYIQICILYTSSLLSKISEGGWHACANLVGNDIASKVAEFQKHMSTHSPCAPQSPRSDVSIGRVYIYICIGCTVSLSVLCISMHLDRTTTLLFHMG